MGFSKKMNIFGGMKIFLDIFVGHYQIGLFLGVISMHYRVFLKVKAQNGGGGGYFFGRLNFEFFGGCLKFLILFWG